MDDSLLLWEWLIPLLGTGGTTWSPGFHGSPSGGQVGGAAGRGRRFLVWMCSGKMKNNIKSYLNGQKFPFWIRIFVSKEDVQTLEQVVQGDMESSSLEMLQACVSSLS